MNNYLNNTLTNLHLQDFLKEKGLDVSHMRYISDRQLAVDNLHMVPNMKDYLKSGYFILDGLAKAILSSKETAEIISKLHTDGQLSRLSCSLLNQYINVFGADYPDAESFAENLVNYEDVLHSVLEKERPGTAAAYDLKFYTFLKEGKHERLIHLFYELSFSDRNDFLIQLFMKENWQEELIKFYLIEDLPEEFSFRSSVFILQNSVPESYFRLAKVLTYPGTLDIYKMAGDCVNKVYLHEKGYAKQAEDIAAILSKFKGLFDSEEFEEDIKQDFFRRLYDIDYQEKTLSEYKRYIMKHLDKDAVKNSLWGINSFLSACTGNKYEKLMKEIDSGSYSHIEAFARKCLINNKTACLRLMQDNLKEFAKLPINSILFSNEFWQLCNMNTLTIKDLQKLQKYKYLYTTNNIDLSLFYNHTYTFPEFLSISLKNRKLIEIYNSLDPSMRVDEKLRRIRQLFHESIRMDNFPEDLISAVAKTLSKEPLSDYINRHSYLKETASISDFLYLESIESYNPGLKEVINEITGRIDILAVVNNYNNPKLKELGLKDFKNAYVSLDEDSAWLKEELPIPEEHQKSFLEFCLQGNASVTKSYYDDQYEKGQKNVLLLAKAAVYGKLDEVKYENFNAEIGFTLTGDQKEVWKENSKKQQYGLKATENTDFESCMKIGAVPTWTCMNYKSGQYNECLLSVFDANKKVLYVDKGSKCVARAIMRLTKMSDTAVNKTLSFRDVAEDAAMESGSDEKLVIFLERMYFSHLTNAEIIQVNKNTSNVKKQIPLSSYARSKVGSSIANAFDTLDFKIYIDPSVNYSGYYSTKDQSITLRKNDNVLYHELGHFVSFISGCSCSSAEFKDIYNKEKSKYTKYNKAYVCHSADEFYAECYYLYLFDKSWLKKQLPQTYQYIEKSLAKITPDRINRIYKTYSVIWK